MGNYKRLTAEDFIRIWQAADSVEQVSEQTGMWISACSSRSRTYRERGVMLRELPRRRVRRNDWAGLPALPYTPHVTGVTGHSRRSPRKTVHLSPDTWNRLNSRRVEMGITWDELLSQLA